MSEMVDIFQVLKDLDIPYEKQEHKAIFSEEDSKKHRKKIILVPWKK